MRIFTYKTFSWVTSPNIYGYLELSVFYELRICGYPQLYVFIHWLRTDAWLRSCLLWGLEYRDLEYQTFLSSDFQWVGFGMVGCSNSRGLDHSKTESLNPTKWQRISNVYGQNSDGYCNRIFLHNGMGGSILIQICVTSSVNGLRR